MGEWIVTTKWKNGKMLYAVCRVIDINQDINKYNLQFASDFSEDLEEMENLAKKLNLREGE